LRRPKQYFVVGKETTDPILVFELLYGVKLSALHPSGVRSASLGPAGTPIFSRKLKAYSAYFPPLVAKFYLDVVMIFAL